MSILSSYGLLWIPIKGQKMTKKLASYMSPIMIVGFSFFSPAAVTLYWVVGGFIQIIQQFIINYIIRPRLRKQVAEEFEKNPPIGLKKASRAKDVTPKAQQAIEQKNKKKNQ